MLSDGWGVLLAAESAGAPATHGAMPAMRRRAQQHADLAGHALHQGNDLVHARLVGIGVRAGHADRCDDGAAGIAHGRAHAADAVDVFSQVEGIALGRIDRHRGQPFIQRQASAHALGGFLFVTLFPRDGPLIQDQRLAHAGAAYGLAAADARVDLDGPLAADLVEIDDAFIFVERGQVHGVLRLRGQLFEQGPRRRGDGGVAVGHEAQLDQPAAQAIALARLEAQIAYLHQRRGQPVGGAEGDAGPVGDVLHAAAAFGHRADHVESSEQGLAGKRLSWRPFRP